MHRSDAIRFVQFTSFFYAWPNRGALETGSHEDFYNGNAKQISRDTFCGLISFDCLPDWQRSMFDRYVQKVAWAAQRSRCDDIASS